MSLIVFERSSHGFGGEKEGDQHSHDAHTTKYDEGGSHSDSLGITVFLAVMGSPQKSNGADDCPNFAGGAGNAVTGGPEPGREELGGEYKGCSVGSEIGEEESEGIEDHEALVVVGVPIEVIGNADGEKSQSHEEEAHELDLDSADAIDEIDGEEVAGNGGTDGDDCLEPGNVDGLLVNREMIPRFEVSVVNLGLEQIAAVEYDVHEKPAGATGEEVPAVAAEELPGKQRVGGRGW